MNEITLLDLPTTIPTMAVNCIATTNALNSVWITNSKIIAISFLIIGVVIGGIMGYLYGRK